MIKMFENMRENSLNPNNGNRKVGIDLSDHGK
jgi:hypothetical protein